MSDQKKFEELRDALSPEPVAEWVRADNGNYAVLRWHKDYVATIGDKLYTSAPTIPAGWQLITEPDAIGYGRLVVDGKYYGLPMSVIVWLAAAPKGETA